MRRDSTSMARTGGAFANEHRGGAVKASPAQPRHRLDPSSINRNPGGMPFPGPGSVGSDCVTAPVIKRQQARGATLHVHDIGSVIENAGLDNHHAARDFKTRLRPNTAVRVCSFEQKNRVRDLTHAKWTKPDRKPIWQADRVQETNPRIARTPLCHQTGARNDIRARRQLFRADRAHTIFSANWTKEGQFESGSGVSDHNACQAVSTDRARIHCCFPVFVPR